MTSITLPLKKFPGHTRHAPTFFGGRSLVTPMVLLFTIPFTLYLYYHLSYDSLLSYNLLGLLPYIWGSISIFDCVKKSGDSIEELFEADLSKAKQIFDKTKNHFRSVLITNITFSIINFIVLSYSLIVYRELSLFIVGLNSIISIEIALASILSCYEIKRIFIYICLICVSEVVFLLITFRGLWMFYLIFLIGIFLSLLLCLHLIDKYNLRSFFERVIN